jgi:excisionase family DNA binding protein
MKNWKRTQRTPKTEVLLTVEEVAVILRVRPKTVRKWIYLRRIAFVRIGRCVRFSRRAIDHFIRSNSCGSNKTQMGRP